VAATSGGGRLYAMRGRDRARILAPAVLGGWLTGCFGVGWQTIYSSVPRLEPSVAWSQTGDDEFTTTGMKVRIWAHNVVFGREWGAGVVFLIPIPLAPGQPAAKPPRPFRIQLIFHVETEDFTFDAGRVTLASERLPPMTPTREVEQVIRLEPHPYPSSIYVLRVLRYRPARRRARIHAPSGRIGAGGLAPPAPTDSVQAESAHKVRT
jgi:hypothetical protein